MGMLIEYPAKLPAPLSGRISPTERRFISEVPGRPNYRTRQRDYHGTKDIDFIFTPDEAETFRYWWAKWLARGAVWFVADWPLLPQRMRNVYRFTKPPTWALEGGAINGQGYWRVSATVEIRGRGMLPELPVYSVSSKLYPILEIESITTSLDRIWPEPNYYFREGVTIGASVIAGSGTQITYETYNAGAEQVHVSAKVIAASATQITYETYNAGSEQVHVSAKVIAGSSVSVPIIKYDNYPPEGVNVAMAIVAFTVT